MKISKNSLLLTFLSVLVILNSEILADQAQDVILQAQENPNEEEQISDAIRQEQEFEAENGGGALTHVPEHNVGHDQIEGEDTHVELDPNNPSENMAGEDQFMANSDIINDGVSDESDAETYIITLNSHNEMTRLKNFRAVSQNMKVFEEGYRTCLQKIPSLVWSEDEIQKCVGPDFTQIVNDINYERAKIKDRAAIKLRQIVIKECYEQAGTDEIQSDSCDAFETDMMKILWDQMDIYKMMVFNRDKYLFVYGRMNPETFDKMMLEVKPVNEDLSALIDEVEAHRDLIVVRIKGFVDDRTKAIVNLANFNKRNGVESIKSYDVHITQTVKDNGISVASLPSNVPLDTKTDNVFGESPYPEMDEVIQNMRSQNLDGLYDESRNVNFDQGDHEPQEFVINQFTGDNEDVPLKAKLHRKLTQRRQYAKTERRVNKMELMKIKRELAMKKQRSRTGYRYNLL